MGEESREFSVDVLERLRELVGESAEIEEEYGGYAIRIREETLFPWSKVCGLLIGLNHEVWIERRGEHLYVVSKPIAD
ncbi:MAG: hypothetical protein QXO86_07510 [Nitrososphaerota archaeon]